MINSPSQNFITSLEKYVIIKIIIVYYHNEWTNDDRVIGDMYNLCLS